MDWLIYRQRARILQAIRTFFIERDYLEIDAPILTPCPTLDNNILSISADICDMFNRPHRHFMHTSPEHAMKKLLAAGSGNCFFLGKVFRDAEITNLHNPEFTMAEWYQIDATYQNLIEQTQSLILSISSTLSKSTDLNYQNQQLDLSPPWPIRTVTSLFEEYADINHNDLLKATQLRQAATNLQIDFSADDDWETLFHRIFMERIEPNLGFPKPVFVTDYPAQMGLMAKRKTDDSKFVERVELFISGLELANGYTELRDPDELRQRFEEQQRLKAEAGYPDYPLDNKLLAVLPDMPACAGIALGVDRLIMLLLNQSQIGDVIYFPMGPD